MVPRNDGEKTRQRILEVAEELFSEKGFDGTSVDRIAARAKVNKALIYYYFADKADLVVSLFDKILREVEERVGSTHLAAVEPSELRDKIKLEVEFLESRRQILSVMLMEGLKHSESSDYLFRCAERVMAHTSGTDVTQRERVYEFFTGFVPIVFFVAMREKWLEHYGGDAGELIELFLDAFMGSHLNVKNHHQHAEDGA